MGDHKLHVEIKVTGPDGKQREGSIGVNWTEDRPEEVAKMNTPTAPYLKKVMEGGI